MTLTQTQVIQIKFKTTNGKTIKKSEPVNRNRPNNKSNPRQVELEAPCLSANPDNSNTLNIASNNLTPGEKLASILEKIRTRGFDSMLGVESAEAKPCGYKVNGKEITSEEAVVIRQKGGTYRIETRTNKTIKIREDFAESSFVKAETRLKKSLGDVEINMLSWDVPVDSVQTINGTKFTRVSENATGGKIAPNGRTFDFEMPNGQKGSLSWHHDAHPDLTSGDFNAGQPHFNLEFKGQVKTESHITYPNF